MKGKIIPANKFDSRDYAARVLLELSKGGICIHPNYVSNMRRTDIPKIVQKRAKAALVIREGRVVGRRD